MTSKSIYGCQGSIGTNGKYHYVYRITNIVENKHYYGVRSSKTYPMFDIGKKYFSSSHDENFIIDQKKNSQHYKYKVVGIFETRTEAIDREIRLHKLFKVNVNESFYNKSIQTSSGFDVSDLLKGKPKSEEHKKKLSAAKIGTKRSDEVKAKISKSFTGVPKSEEHKSALRRYVKTEEHRQNLSKVGNARSPAQKAADLANKERYAKAREEKLRLKDQLKNLH